MLLFQFPQEKAVYVNEGMNKEVEWIYMLKAVFSITKDFFFHADNIDFDAHKY